MKNLTKLSIVIFMFFLSTQLFSQTIRVKGGLNLSKMYMVDSDNIISDQFDFLTGFNAGLTSEFPISNIFSIETGLILNSKGFKFEDIYDDGYDNYKVTVKYDLLYLDIPISAKASIDVGDVKLYGTFGPYLGIGLKGKMIYEETYNGDTESVSENIDFGYDKEEDLLKRFDFGLTVGGGVEYKSISLGVQYGLGLTNLNPDSDYDGKGNNRALAISLGYKLFEK